MNLKKILLKVFQKKNKVIPSKYHYDYQGSKYFEKITKTKRVLSDKKGKGDIKKIKKKYQNV